MNNVFECSLLHPLTEDIGAGGSFDVCSAISKATSHGACQLPSALHVGMGMLMPWLMPVSAFLPHHVSFQYHFPARQRPPAPPAVNHNPDPKKHLVPVTSFVDTSQISPPRPDNNLNGAPTATSRLNL